MAQCEPKELQSVKMRQMFFLQIIISREVKT